MTPGFDSPLTGRLVRLGALPPDQAAVVARWDANTEFHRMMDDDPQYPFSVQALAFQSEMHLGEDGKTSFGFSIYALADDKLIGTAGLYSIKWLHGRATVGIGIGEPDYWGHGYGTDAMRLILNYAFRELNLYRVGLFVFSYNQRAIRSYEKCGFVREGVIRGVFQRDGQRYDHIYMGILREEWAAQNPAT